MTYVVQADRLDDAAADAHSPDRWRLDPTSLRSRPWSPPPTGLSDLRGGAGVRTHGREDPAAGRGAACEAPAGVEITGTTPLFADIAELFSTRLWVVVAFVVGVSMILLGMVFRSVVVPLKAAAMNLLSIGAAFGVMTAIFQWGWGRSARPRPRDAGVELDADPPVRRAVRPVDGLRGLPALADP